MPRLECSDACGSMEFDAYNENGKLGIYCASCGGKQDWPEVAV